MELIVFLYFGINIFIGCEWGDGKENFVFFNFIDFDVEQWVCLFKEVGFKMVILIVKYYDGFCLWLIKIIGYFVVVFFWKDGKGDVVCELCDVCDKYGIKFGVYFFFWDWNVFCYGDFLKYNEFFIE